MSENVAPSFFSWKSKVSVSSSFARAVAPLESATFFKTCWYSLILFVIARIAFVDLSSPNICDRISVEPLASLLSFWMN